MAFKENRTGLYKLINNLSIDVVIGSVASYYFFSEVLNVTPDIVSVILLGIAVWSIYTLDHLIDSRKIDINVATDRHLFHKANYSILSWVVLALLALAIILIAYIPTSTIIAGAMLSGLVILYFITIHLLNLSKVIFHKELTVATLYSIGVILGPFSLYTQELLSHHKLLFASFFCIVFMNVIIFAFFDRESDCKANFQSIPLKIGVLMSHRLIHFLSLSVLILNLTLIWIGFEKEALCIFSMHAVLYSLFLFQENYFVRTNFRYIGDGIFFIPLFYLL